MKGRGEGEERVEDVLLLLLDYCMFILCSESPRQDEGDSCQGDRDPASQTQHLRQSSVRTVQATRVCVCALILSLTL